MKANGYKLKGAPIAAVMVLLSVGGCDALVEAFDCEGHVANGYSIPDIVLVSRAERYVRDLEAHPEVFYQTRGERLFFDAESSNYGVADTFTDEYGFLTVVAGRPGRARIEVEAWDSCHTSSATIFYVDVVSYGPTDSPVK